MRSRSSPSTYIQGTPVNIGIRGGPTRQSVKWRGLQTERTKIPISDSTERKVLPDAPLQNVDRYLRFTEILPAEINGRISRYIDPLTGERRNFKYDNLIALAELHYLHDHLRHVPTSADFEEHSEISIVVY